MRPSWATRYAKFSVVVRDDGSLRVVKQDGTPCFESDAKFVASAVTYALKSEANTLGSAKLGTGKTREHGVEFEVDPMLVELDALRAKVPGLSKARLAAFLGISRPVVGDWIRGAGRPHLEDFRTWASMPGISMVPMLVPAALVEVVTLLKKKFLDHEDQQQDGQ